MAQDPTRLLLERGLVPTRKLSAALLGVTPQALSLWAKEDWFDAAWKIKEGRDDCYNVPAIREARDAAGRKGSSESDLSRKIAVETKQEKLDIIRMEREERQLQKAERLGNVLPRDEYTLAIRECIVVARDRLTSLPKQLARLAPTKALQKKLITEGDRVVRKILTELARAVEKTPS